MNHLLKKNNKKLKNYNKIKKNNEFFIQKL